MPGLQAYALTLYWICMDVCTCVWICVWTFMFKYVQVESFDNNLHSIRWCLCYLALHTTGWSQHSWSFFFSVSMSHLAIGMPELQMCAATPCSVWVLQLNSDPHAFVVLSVPTKCFTCPVLVFWDRVSHVALDLPGSCFSFLVLIFFLKYLVFLVVWSTEEFILIEMPEKHAFEFKTHCFSKLQGVVFRIYSLSKVQAFSSLSQLCVHAAQDLKQHCRLFPWMANTFYGTANAPSAHLPFIPEPRPLVPCS